MAEQIFSKDLTNPGYGDDKMDRHDFAIKGELTVTITLNEYRMLVQQQGAYEKKLEEVREHNAELWSENQKLKGTIETLKSNLDDGGDDE